MVCGVWCVVCGGQTRQCTYIVLWWLLAWYVVMRYPEYSSVQVVGHSSLAGNIKSLDLEVQQTAQGTLCSYTFSSGAP